MGRAPTPRISVIGSPSAISDQRQSVVDDVRRIREHPQVPGRIPIDGFIDQVETGELIEIAEASAVGEVR
jgi:carbonic anhydrase